MSAPSIAVVIAIRDQARYLPDALDSVERQTLQPQQVIVVDDGSTDGTGDVARERGVTTLVTEGIGPAGARQLGLDAVETEYVAMLDGDDRFTPGHHELLAAAIGDADAVGGRVRQFYDPGREEELAAKYALEEEPKGVMLGSMLIRCSSLRRLGGFPQDGQHDFIQVIRMLGDFPRIEQVTLERRIHGANMTIVDRELMREAYLRTAREAIMQRRQGGGES